MSLCKKSQRMTDNIDLTTLRGVSGGGPQKTLATKIQAFPDTKTLVFESIPSNCSWGMVSRTMVPGGSQIQRANFWPLWRRVLLRFDCGLGAPVGDNNGQFRQPGNLDQGRVNQEPRSKVHRRCHSTIRTRHCHRAQPRADSVRSELDRH